MPPKVTDIRKKGAKKIRTVLGAEKGLIKRSSVLQKSLYRYLATSFLPSFDIDDDGNIKNSTKNLNKIASASKLRAYFRKEVNKPLLDDYNKSFRSLQGDSESYYNEFDVKQGIVKNVFKRSDIAKNAFLNEVFDNNDVIRQIQASIRNGITTQQPFAGLKDLLGTQVRGTEDKLGLIEGYHYRAGIEEFQAYTRSLDEQFSKALKLNYAIYAGTEIKTTRQFCDSRVGNVYNRETILSWQDLDFQGKKANHNILIDLGGYNCRHDLNWISYEVAKRIDKNIEKSEFDK